MTKAIVLAEDAVDEIAASLSDEITATRNDPENTGPSAAALLSRVHSEMVRAIVRGNCAASIWIADAHPSQVSEVVDRLNVQCYSAVIRDNHITVEWL